MPIPYFLNLTTRAYDPSHIRSRLYRLHGREQEHFLDVWNNRKISCVLAFHFISPLGPSHGGREREEDQWDEWIILTG